MPSIKPFTLAVPNETLAHIRQRVTDYPWHEMPDDGVAIEDALSYE